MHVAAGLSQAIEKANSTSTAMLVHESGRASSVANIPMHVAAGLSQAIEKANSTSTAMQAHEKEADLLLIPMLIMSLYHV